MLMPDVLRPRMPVIENAPPAVLLFPGQGAQHLGMGADVLSKYPRIVAQCDSLLGYSLRELCLFGPIEKLNHTLYTQPALYVVGALSYLDYVDGGGRRPAFAAGLSLGEYNALFAAGVFDLLTGMQIVQRRAELMAQVRNGAMSAILGASKEDIQNCLSKAGITSLDIANENSLSQYVLSGPEEDLRRARVAIEQQVGASTIGLPVSGAFHSRYMAGARVEFEQYLAGIAFRRPEITVMANATGRPYGEDIAVTLAEQLTSPVKWVDCINYVLSQRGYFEAIELGPGRSLTEITNSVMRQLEWAKTGPHGR